MSKFESNRARDQVSIARLNQLGWHVILLWECATKPSGPVVAKIVSRVAACLPGRSLRQANAQAIIST